MVPAHNPDHDVQEVAVENRRFTIAIDGPAGAGKSTVGEIVARNLDAVYFDTGVLYRALTLLSLRCGINPSDAERLATCARSMNLHLTQATIADGRQNDVILDGEDVTPLLRTPDVDRHVSQVSAHRLVRDALLEQQREIGRSGRVVMVGRDIGTVVLPDAELKVFLDASLEERARRRLIQRGDRNGESFVATLDAMRRRDESDAQRDVSPLRAADDAVVVNTDGVTIEDVANRIVDEAQRRHLVGDLA